MLNAVIERDWLNMQYHRLMPGCGVYEVEAENSVLFEIDGPYKAMFLPASEKENKQLKKRYAVYDFEGRITELKGFELKRRGELQVLKAFQEDVFHQFLAGSSRSEVYQAVGHIAERWLRFVKGKGQAECSLKDVIALLEESTTMTKPAESNPLKSMGVTAAHRLCDLRNDSSYITQKGVKAAYVVTALPQGEVRTARAIPTSVFDEPESKCIQWIKRWTSDSGHFQSRLDKSAGQEKGADLRSLLKNLLDWDYYSERLTTTIQKIVVIPALHQGVTGSICSAEAPAWLQTRRRNHHFDRQTKLNVLSRTLISEDPETNKENKVTDQTAEQRSEADEIIQLREKWRKWMMALPTSNFFTQCAFKPSLSLSLDQPSIILDVHSIRSSCGGDVALVVHLASPSSTRALR